MGSKVTKEKTKERLNGRNRTARYLLQQMRGAKPGTMLSSFRKLSQECKVSPITTTEVVHNFAEKGLLNVKPRSGIFVPNTLPANWSDAMKVNQISVFYVGAETNDSSINTFRQELISSLSIEPGNRGISARFHAIDDTPNGIRQIQDFVTREQCDACLVVHLSSTDILEPFIDEHVPFACIYPESPCLPTNNSILVDAEKVTELQVAYLLDLGHKRIGYLHNINPYVYQRGNQLRRETFYRLALDRNLPISSDLVQYAGMDRDQEEHGITTLLKQKNPPTAVICNDAHLPMLYSVASSLGIKIGKDLSVVGTNDGAEAQAVVPQATTIRIPRQEAVIAALNMLDNEICSPTANAPNSFVDVNIIERNSSCRIS